jgi:hypothetical protein
VSASSTASELVVIASHVLDHPESRLYRSALAYAAGEVIRSDGDETVLQAIELAPNLKVARAIRDAAEAACETVSVTSNGAERHARLFSIAFVVRFAEPMTTQEWSDRLAPIVRAGPLLARVHEGGTPHASSFIWPRAFAFDDLSNVSLRDVRQRTIMASTASAATNGGMTTLFPMSATAQRRSATFLRYLVGCQVASDAVSDHSHDHDRFGDCVRSLMRSSLPDARDVAVLYTGRFYAPLWHGLHAYHEHRLAEVVAAMGSRGLSVPGLATSITVTASRNSMAAQIAFLSGGKKIDDHVYRVALEPLADPKTSVALIGARLRSLGVKVHIAAPGAARPVGDRCGVARSSTVARRFASSELALPL